MNSRCKGCEYDRPNRPNGGCILCRIAHAQDIHREVKSTPECIHCGTELKWDGQYGNSEDGKVGDIYRCPNHKGFSTVQDVKEYLDLGDDELCGYLSVNYKDGWEEVVCESMSHDGYYHTDKQGVLHEGYPCW